MITIDQARISLPGNKNISGWVDVLNTTLPKYQIDSTPERLAAFLSQTGHESNDYNSLTENLNYSSTALLALFGKYFPNKDVSTFGRNPELIANRIYSNRMGNGPEISGDGWKYRGRGILQITGKSNYQALSTFLCGDNKILDNPDMVSSSEYAVGSACWFWVKNNLNAVADTGNVEALTRKVNGGILGLPDRQARYTRTLLALRG